MLKDIADFMERAAFQKIYLTGLLLVAIFVVKSGMVEEGKLLMASTIGALFMGMRPGGSTVSTATVETPPPPGGKVGSVATTTTGPA